MGGHKVYTKKSLEIKKDRNNNKRWNYKIKQNKKKGKKE